MRKYFYSSLCLIELLLSSFSCNTKGGKTSIIKDVDKKVRVEVSNNLKTKTLECKLINNDKINYYIPDNGWRSYSHDTLYLEAVYKRRSDDDNVISYNQFNPPKFVELKSGSIIDKNIDYKSISVKAPTYIAVRVFKSKYPYDPKKNYEKYHSLDAFLDFEKTNSFLLIEKVENIKSSKTNK